MSVVVRDMRMPKDCRECATIAVGSYAICKKLSTIITGMSIIIDELRKRGNR